MAVKARFYINSVTKFANQHTKVEMRPVVRGDKSGLEADAINKPWSKFTPSGLFEIQVSPDTEAGAWFAEHLGEDIDITIDAVQPAPEPTPQSATPQGPSGQSMIGESTPLQS